MGRPRPASIPSSTLANELLAKTSLNLTDLRAITPTRFDEIKHGYENINLHALKLLGLATPHDEYKMSKIPLEIQKMQVPQPLDLKHSWCRSELPNLTANIEGAKNKPLAVEIVNAYPLTNQKTSEIEQAIHKMCSLEGVRVKRVSSSTNPEYKLKRVFIELLDECDEDELRNCAIKLGKRTLDGRELVTSLVYDDVFR